MILRDIIILWKWLVRQGFPCLFHSLTGLYCPGCGGTRAVKYLLQGDLIKSLRYHPLVAYMVFAGVCWAISGIGSAVKRSSLRYQKRYQDCCLAAVWIGAGIMIANWIIKNWFLIVKGIDLLA